MKIADKISIFFACAGFLFTWIVLAGHDIGFSPDSTFYYAAITNLKNGNGLVNWEGNFINHWPPFYPLTIAFFSFCTGLDPLISAKFVSAISFASSVIFFNLIIKSLQASWKETLFLNITLMILPFSTYFLMLWSETLFFPFLMAFSYFFILYLQNNQLKFIFLSGICASFMLVTRYAGAGFMFTPFVIFLIQDKLSKNFWKKSIVFGSTAISLLIVWLIYSKINSASATNRSFVFHPLTLIHIKDIVLTFGSWILPQMPKIGFWIFLAISLYCIYYLKFKSDKKINVIILFSVTSGVFYLLFLIFTVSFIDFNTPLDSRMIGVILPFVLIGTFELLKKVQIFHYSIFFILLIPSLLSFYKNNSLYYSEGLGYRSDKIKNTELISIISSNPKKTYSNGFDVILANHIQSQTRSIPNVKYSSSTLKNDNYEKEMQKIESELKEKKARIVWLYRINRNYLPSSEEIKKRFSSFEIKLYKEGFIIE